MLENNLNANTHAHMANQRVSVCWCVKIYKGRPFQKKQSKKIQSLPRKLRARFYFQLRVGVAVFINLARGVRWVAWKRYEGQRYAGQGRLLILGQDPRPLSERDGCPRKGPDTCCKQNAR